MAQTQNTRGLIVSFWSNSDTQYLIVGSSKPSLLYLSSLEAHRLLASIAEMKKGLHPQMQWISYVTQSGRLMHVMMTKIHHVGKVYHLKAKRQMAENLGQIAKFRQRYEKGTAPKDEP